MATIHRNTRLWYLAAFFLLILAGVSQATKIPSLSGVKNVSCTACGEERSYHLYAGTNDDQTVEPQDLMLVLHGFRSTAAKTITRTKGAFEQLAHTENMVVIHAQAAGPNWAFGDSGSNGRSYDESYFNAVWNDVRRDYSSLQRIHLVGLSRGAMAAYFLACKDIFPVKSLTVFAMPMPEHSANDCQTAQPIDFTLANGTEDPIVPYKGGDIALPWYALPGDRVFGSVLTTEQTLDYWREHNECEADLSAKTTLNKVSDGTTLTLRSWETCTGGAVTHYKIDGGGHRWLNSRWDPIAWALLGYTSREVSTVPTVGHSSRDD